ncbi:MAG: hypothetical protein E6J90_32940 [Deltaproteobacteria bacterium]|nr:MAG: hypothetical protein E6J90_32940 [Deltaproteobacteria bacterium]TMQ23291.1 MAG: hypothetical protein E6J91_00225 [Deltaproteobacteria bacterium]
MRWERFAIALALLACSKPKDAPQQLSSRGGSAMAGSGSASSVVAIDARPKRLLDELLGLPRNRPGNRDDAMAQHRRAMAEHAAAHFDTAEQLWAEAARTDPSWDWPFYNLACVASRMGRSDDALAYLDAVHTRKPAFEMLRRIETDHDLDAVRAHPELAALIKQIAEDLLVGSRGSCLGEAHPKKNWPTSRKLGAPIRTPESAIAIGCLK